MFKTQYVHGSGGRLFLWRHLDRCKFMTSFSARENTLCYFCHISHYQSNIGHAISPRYTLKNGAPLPHKCLSDPDTKVHGTNMGPTWVLSAPDGPHVGPIDLAIKGIGSPFVHVMACRLFRAELLPKPILTFCWTLKTKINQLKIPWFSLKKIHS